MRGPHLFPITMANEDFRRNLYAAHLHFSYDALPFFCSAFRSAFLPALRHTCRPGCGLYLFLIFLPLR